MVHSNRGILLGSKSIGAGMANLFYQILVYFSRICGAWVFYAACWIIATVYFLFFPRRVAVSVRFYRAVFPNRPAWYPLWCAWKQFHNFTTIYIDRFYLIFKGDIHYTAQGWHYIEKAAENGTGGILLMSHLGNWEIAAHLLKKKGIPLLLFMGEKTGEQIEKTQKNTLQSTGVEIIASPLGQSSPMDILEGLRHLRKGWMLSIAGDRFGSANRSYVEAEFLGHIVRLPETPYAMAIATGAPVFIFFAVRTGRQRYHFIIHPPIFLRSGARKTRRKSVRDAAQLYARHLEQTVCQHPFEWHHFEPFLGSKKVPESNYSQGG